MVLWHAKSISVKQGPKSEEPGPAHLNQRPLTRGPSRTGEARERARRTPKPNPGCPAFVLTSQESPSLFRQSEPRVPYTIARPESVDAQIENTAA